MLKAHAVRRTHAPPSQGDQGVTRGGRPRLGVCCGALATDPTTPQQRNPLASDCRAPLPPASTLPFFTPHGMWKSLDQHLEPAQRKGWAAAALPATQRGHTHTRRHPPFFFVEGNNQAGRCCAFRSSSRSNMACVGCGAGMRHEVDGCAGADAPVRGFVPCTKCKQLGVDSSFCSKRCLVVGWAKQ